MVYIIVTEVVSSISKCLGAINKEMLCRNMIPSKIAMIKVIYSISKDSLL